MGEAVWLPNPPKARPPWALAQHGGGGGEWLPNMARVVIVLLQQCDDQLKIGLSWMEVHTLPLVTN